VAELTGHTSRVLHMAMSPDGSTVVSAAGDETLRFWKIFDLQVAQREKQSCLFPTSDVFQGVENCFISGEANCCIEQNRTRIWTCSHSLIYLHSLLSPLFFVPLFVFLFDRCGCMFDCKEQKTNFFVFGSLFHESSIRASGFFFHSKLTQKKESSKTVF
jgi:hypothetical protein